MLLGMPGVAEVAVVSVPDLRLGERAAAVIRPKPAAPAPMERMRSHLEKAGLARQKWPEKIHLRDDLPGTASGKVQKFLLRTDIAARSDHS